VSGLAPRALRNCAPAAPSGASARPLNFTVRDVALDSSVPPSSPVERAFVAVNRAFGVLALVGGLSLLAKCAWHLLTGARDWSQSYFAVLFGVALVIVGIVYLGVPLWRHRSEVVRDASSQDH
jgi:hypothetical protein